MYTVTAKSKQLGAPQVASCLRKRCFPLICIKVGCRPVAALHVIHVWIVRWEAKTAGGFWKNFPFPIHRGHPRRTLHPPFFPTGFSII